MKANKAPEKIYVDNLNHDFFYRTKDVNSIEYTRTDAFIEKAADWLNNFYNEDTHSCLIDEDIEKFIKYMKGE